MTKNKPTIAILGYGTQGRAWAQNLTDSGANIIIGLPTGGKSRRLAKKDKIKNVTTVRMAASKADIVVFAFPDHLHGAVYKKEMAPNLKPGSCLVFLHGFSIHFKTIVPSEDNDVILLAPLAPGTAVREKYLNKESVGYFYSVFQDVTGHANNTLNYLIKYLRINRKTMIKTTFEDEAIGDLFGEQAVLCGGLSQLIKLGYETLTESGLSSDKAYLEVAFQLDLIIDLIRKYGIEGMYSRISIAARYGSLLNGPKIIDGTTKVKMKRVLAEIRDGSFAAKLNNLSDEKIKLLNKNIKTLSNPSYEEAASKFSPLNKKKK